MSVTLRPYQESLVGDIRGAFRQHRRVLAVAPTGAGKTVIFTYISTGASAKGNRVVILAHRTEIVEQISLSLDRMGVRHGRITPTHRMTDDLVQAAMVQTLARRIHQIPEPALLVVDECISGDAVVATDIGDVPMRDIPTSGARFALSWDGSSHVWRPITAWWKSGNRSVLRVHLSNGKSIVCTPDHLFYVDGKWQQAKNLEIGAGLVSSAAFADAAAGRVFSEISVAAEGSTNRGIGPGAFAPTGTRLTQNMCVGRRSAAAVAESTSSPSLIQRMSSSTFTKAAFAIRDMCMGITAGMSGRLRFFLTSSAAAFSEAFSEMVLSACPTLAASISAPHGRTVQHKRLGFGTRPTFFSKRAPSSPLPKMLDTGARASACERPVSPASAKLHPLSFGAAESPSRANGWIKSAITASLGGIATTGTEAGARPISILRGIPSTRPIPSGDGSLIQSAHAGSIRTATGSHSSGSHSQQASGCSSEFPSSSPHQCNTNCLTVTRIEDAGNEDVFDITVEGTHCFFANGALVHNCHHATAGAWRTITDAWPNAKVLGVTATPARLDGKGLAECFDEMVLGPAMAELIEAGFLARYTYLAPPEQADLSGIKTRGGDFAVNELAAAMDKSVITGDAIGHYRAHLGGRPAICFCVTVEHAEHVAEQFRTAGFRAASVDGSMNRAERRDRIAAIGDGRLQVLTSCDIISEGTDIPCVAGAILLRPTKSLGLFLQQVGRALRPKPDGGSAVILDHVGNVHRHGMPDAPREWSLTPAKKKKPAADVRQCEQCFKVFAVKPGWRDEADCGEGGSEGDYPAGCALNVPAAGSVGRETPETVEGTLTEVAPSPSWTMGISITAAKGSEWFRLLRLADTEDKLREVARARGYKRGWIQHILNERRGRTAPAAPAHAAPEAVMPPLSDPDAVARWIIGEAAA